jgi:hypothetical protein
MTTQCLRVAEMGGPEPSEPDALSETTPLPHEAREPEELEDSGDRAPELATLSRRVSSWEWRTASTSSRLLP